MNEEFISKGIQNDRYLKAVRLYKEFEEEMFTVLKNVSKDVIEAKPAWFPDDLDQAKNQTRRRTEPLGHIRLDTKIARVNASGDQLKFHVCIEWTQPEVHRHDEHSDGSLCIIFYKIKNLDRAEYDQIRQQTKQDDKWDAIQFDDDLWNDDLGLFYIPVDSGSAVKEGFEILKEHFIEFGDEYGEPAVKD
ncbi:hypothetical protein SVXHr_2752 [Halorhabdus sp. SVX81]|uniref:hypothetical protein n=1 Tax=Halorhabdus sp. SVX81 TaxID=2978283 RepID=UPI0023DB70CA|nr:hypothetical protein [Halorhabdus sp. SVX81]WEL18895.1 hypothetical protein SVXHr_2752 [Halorhabdus sp. SVX81]